MRNVSNRRDTKVKTVGHPFPKALAAFQAAATSIRKSRGRPYPVAEFAASLFGELSMSPGLRRLKADEMDVHHFFSLLTWRAWTETRQRKDRKPTSAESHTDRVASCLEQLISLLEDPKYGKLRRHRESLEAPFREHRLPPPYDENRNLILLRDARLVHEVLSIDSYRNKTGPRTELFVAALKSKTPVVALQIEIGEALQRRFGERMPGLVADIFNTPTVQKAFGLKRKATASAINRAFRLAARSVPGFTAKEKYTAKPKSPSHSSPAYWWPS